MGRPPPPRQPPKAEPPGVRLGGFCCLLSLATTASTDGQPVLPDRMASTRPVFWIARFTACSNCCVIVWTSDELLAPVPPPAPNSLATYHSDGRRPGLARRVRDRRCRRGLPELLEVLPDGGRRGLRRLGQHREVHPGGEPDRHYVGRPVRVLHAPFADVAVERELAPQSREVAALRV